MSTCEILHGYLGLYFLNTYALNFNTDHALQGGKVSHSEDSGLYNVSVTTLEISEKAIRLLNQVGIENVGDCVDFCNRNGNAFGMPHSKPEFMKVFVNEVIPQLQEYGYLSDDDTA